MRPATTEIATDRLRLRRWRDADRAEFAALHSDSEVMDDLGGPIDRVQADEKLQLYISAWENHGFGRWVVESDGRFLGYVGVMPRREDHPLGEHDEIGWRLNKHAWGKGYATEAAHAALCDVFSRVGLREVLAYTASSNYRSQAVIRRLKLRRDQKRDFSVADRRRGYWSGLVWTACPVIR